MGDGSSVNSGSSIVSDEGSSVIDDVSSVVDGTSSDINYPSHVIHADGVEGQQEAECEGSGARERGDGRSKN